MMRCPFSLVAVAGGVWLLVSGAGSAGAMGIRYQRASLARSTDGACALYEVTGWGPEGGGSLSYRVEGKPRRTDVEFLVSSTFSPGGASQPQTVPPETCRQRLAELAAELTRRNIQGVTLHPQGCAGHDREHLATTTTPPPRHQ
jgi:hypothetical protein